MPDFDTPQARSSVWLDGNLYFAPGAGFSELDSQQLVNWYAGFDVEDAEIPVPPTFPVGAGSARQSLFLAYDPQNQAFRVLAGQAGGTGGSRLSSDQILRDVSDEGRGALRVETA